MIGNLQFSGVGGQVDFVRGASRSLGGKSIIALPSTAARGAISRICPRLDLGAAVTTSRNDVHYVVTEYGVANLRGKTLQQRTEALIAVAHPDFRDSLGSRPTLTAAVAV
jgi:4-hydroxybutyrate CoA-transferase